MANTLTRRMHKGPNTTLDEGQTLIPSGGGFDAVAFKIRGGCEGGGKGYLGSEDTAFTLSTGHDQDVAVSVAFKPSHFTRGKDGAPSEVVPPLSADADKGDQESVVAFHDVAGTLKDRGGNHAGNGAEEADRIVGCRDVAQAITQNYGKQPDNSDTALGPNVVSFAQNQLGEVRTGDVAGTVNTNSNASGRNTALAQIAMSVRRLTPTECERLQGFPDGWTERAGETAFSDSTRYKMLGNAVCRNVGEWLALRIKKGMK